MIQENLSVAHKTGGAGDPGPRTVVVDTTVQPKAIAHPTDARLCHRALENWSNWCGATACGYGRAIGVSPSVPRSWSGATRMCSSSSGAHHALSFCAFGSAA